MLKVRLLGKFEVLIEGEPVEIPSRPAQSLLSYLILNAGVAHRREKLAGLLWPDSEETNARSNLRHALWRLRKAIGDEFFDSDKVAICFNSGSDYQLDVDLLKDQPSEVGMSDDLIRVVSIYEGDLLPGFYDEWVTLEREGLRAVFEDRIQNLLDRLVEEGQWREVREWAEFWISQGKSPEPAYRALMAAHSGLGDFSGVAAAYQRCVEALKHELDVEPSDETHTLYERLTERGRPPTTPIERSTQELPISPTPFIGRDEELAQIVKLLSDPECRLLTLVGSGGIGKTRLALQIASEKMGDYPHGVIFVPLASIRSPEFLTSAIVEALGFQLSGADDPYVQLIQYLRQKELLLILDNFEHLLDGAEMVADLLVSAPKIKILVTSRGRLNLRPEHLFEVHGMPIPAAREYEKMSDFDIVQLFQQSANRIQADFSVSEEDKPHLIHICRLVGGIPLGVELAASWVRMLSCEEIAAEIGKSLDFLVSSLHDLPERHKSMTAVFNSSWQLLTKHEQRIFKKLAVFRGGFVREDAERVAGASLPMLLSLTDKSFLHVAPSGRYGIHELLRQYGHYKLRGDPKQEGEIRDLHCETYIDFLSEWEDGLRGGKRRDAVNAIGIEIDNVRAAWNWAIVMRRVDQIQKALESLWLYYDIRSWFKEGFEAFDRAIRTLLASDKPTRELGATIASLLARQAWFGWRLGRYQEATDLAQKSLGVARKLDVPSEAAFCLHVLGTISYAQGSYSEAKEHYQESLEIWREIGNQWGTAITLFSMGQVSHALGEYGEAEQPYREGLEIFRDIGYQYGATFAFDSLGRVARTLGDYVDAKDLCLESLAIRRELDDQWGVAACLDSLGAVLCGLGEYKGAKETCLESLEIKKSLEDQRGIATSLNNLGHVNFQLGDFGQARSYCEEALAIRRDLGDRRGMAASLNTLGNIAIMIKAYPAAKHYCMESLAIRRELGDRRGIAAALNTLGLIAWELEGYQDAGRYFREALAEAVKIGALPMCLEILVGLTRSLVKDEQFELASELLALITIHPASSMDSKAMASALLNEVLEARPSDVIGQAYDRGKTKTLHALIAEILEE
jgi:predicted ATPase/DNA-binding SARP family transcriptional activator